ncbi:MAG: 4'-phosphopantetheinyl transferase superfamily protein [Parasporobacterium sp.]|nr:4'-phosphopantetheinyl transferase superfamily protein [Parasporobacterium sp.]
MYKLYFFNELDALDEELLNRIVNILPNDRRLKTLKYKYVLDRKLSAVSYMLLKYGLKNNFGISNFDITVSKTGKPFLKDCKDVFFSISHCKKGCVCAIGDKNLGVDIQDIQCADGDLMNIAFSRREIIKVNESSDKNLEFTKIWTMKESLVKMTGEGITDKLNKIDTMQIRERFQTIEKEGSVISVLEENI